MLIGTVLDTFEIKGRGVVVALDIPEDSIERADRLRVGEALEIICGGDVVARTAITGIDFLSPPPPKNRAGFLLRDVMKADIPIGAEVWTAD